MNQDEVLVKLQVQLDGLRPQTRRLVVGSFYELWGVVETVYPTALGAFTFHYADADGDTLPVQIESEWRAMLTEHFASGAGILRLTVASSAYPVARPQPLTPVVPAPPSTQPHSPVPAPAAAAAVVDATAAAPAVLAPPPPYAGGGKKKRGTPAFTAAHQPAIAEPAAAQPAASLGPIQQKTLEADTSAAAAAVVAWSVTSELDADGDLCFGPPPLGALGVSSLVDLDFMMPPTRRMGCAVAISPPHAAAPDPLLHLAPLTSVPTAAPSPITVPLPASQKRAQAAAAAAAAATASAPISVAPPPAPPTAGAKGEGRERPLRGKAAKAAAAAAAKVEAAAAKVEASAATISASADADVTVSADGATVVSTAGQDQQGSQQGQQSVVHYKMDTKWYRAACVGCDILCRFSPDRAGAEVSRGTDPVRRSGVLTLRANNPMPLGTAAARTLAKRSFRALIQRCDPEGYVLVGLVPGHAEAAAFKGIDELGGCCVQVSPSHVTVVRGPWAVVAPSGTQRDALTDACLPKGAKVEVTVDPATGTALIEMWVQRGGVKRARLRFDDPMWVQDNQLYPAVSVFSKDDRVRFAID